MDLGTNRIATEIAFGQSYACAVLDDGSVKCWGEGSGHLFGAGGSGTHISIGGDANYTLSPVLLGTGRSAVDIAAASSAMCVVFEDGDVKCWGLADDGILGAGNTTDLGGEPHMGDNLPRVDLGRQRRAFRLAKGSGDTCGHMCAMLSSEDCPICDDEVTCWGRERPKASSALATRRTEATLAIPSPTPATRSISASTFACVPN